MFHNSKDGLRVARTIKVGSVGHFGEYCIVKYSKTSYTVFPSGYLFSASHRIFSGNLAEGVAKVYALSGGAVALHVIIDNN